MAHRSTGGMKPLTFTPREKERACIQTNITPEFHKKVRDYCDDHQLSMTQLVRYLLAREVNQTSK